MSRLAKQIQFIRKWVFNLSILPLMFAVSTSLFAEPLLKRGSEASQPVRIQKDYELYQQLEALRMEIQELRGITEEQAHTIETMKRAQRNRYVDLDQRITELSSRPEPALNSQPVVGSNLPSPVNPSSLPAGTTIAPPLPTLASDTEQSTYHSAKALVDKREYNAAIAEFNLYLEAYSDGKYAPQAHYWLGELYMVLPTPEYASAQQHFGLILEEFPTHTKVPDSLFKLGKLFDIQGDAKMSKLYFDRVIKEYPASVSASLAKQYNK